jgi:WD40 repeat protein
MRPIAILASISAAVLILSFSTVIPSYREPGRTAARGTLVSFRPLPDRPFIVPSSKQINGSYQHISGGAIAAMAWSSDGKCLALSRGFGATTHRLCLVDVTNNCALTPLRSNLPWAAAMSFSHDNSQLACASVNGKLELWNIASRIIVDSYPTDTYGLSVCKFTPQSEFLALVGRGGLIKLLNPKSKSIDQTIRIGNPFTRNLAFIQQHDLLLHDGRDGGAVIRNCEGGAIIKVLKGNSDLARIAVASNGNNAVIGGTDGKLTAIKLPTGDAIWTQATLPMLCVAYTAASEGAILTLESDGCLRYYSNLDGKKLATVKLDKFPVKDYCEASFAPDGRFLAIAYSWGVCVYTLQAVE